MPQPELFDRGPAQPHFTAFQQWRFVDEHSPGGESRDPIGPIYEYDDEDDRLLKENLSGYGAEGWVEMAQRVLDGYGEDEEVRTRTWIEGRP